jgi:hypothetical protein
VRDWAEVIPDAQKFDRAIGVGMTVVVVDTVTTVTRVMRSQHRWQDRTGATRAGITGTFRVTGRGATGYIKSNTPNAIRLNDGTRPHRIAAGGAAVAAFGSAAVIGAKRALKFQMNGQTMFRRAVNHPGTKPDPFLDAAADVAEEDFFTKFDSVFDGLFD